MDSTPESAMKTFSVGKLGLGLMTSPHVPIGVRISSLQPQPRQTEPSH